MGPCGNKKCGFNHNEYENHCEIFSEGIEQGCCEAFLPEEILAPISDVNSRHEWRFRCENLEKEFEQVFQKGQLPEENITVYSIKPTKKQDIIEILTTSGLVKSNSEAKRLINQGGVDIDGFTLKEFSTDKVKDGTVIRAGKKKFVKIKIK